MINQWRKFLTTPYALGAWAALALLLLAVVFPYPEMSRGMAHYAPLHSVLEILSVSVSLMVFAIGWNTHKFRSQGNMFWLCSCFLAVALLDIMHLLSYQEMPDLITPSGPQKAINFWLGARLFAAFGLLTVAVTPWFRFPRPPLYLLPASILGITALYTWLELFHPEVFPVTFIPEQGLTPFKIIAEYVIIGLYGLSAVLFFICARQSSTRSQALFAVAFIMLLSEYFFTLYSDVTDLYNLLGHVYKIVAYWLLYEALFVGGVQAPYIRLAASEKKLSATINALPDTAYELDEKGTLLNLYARESERLGLDADSLNGKNIIDLLPPSALGSLQIAMAEAKQKGVSYGQEIELSVGGKLRIFSLSVSCSDLEMGNGRYIVIARDVTKSKLQQRILAHEARLNEGLLSLSAKALGKGEHALLRFAVEHARYLIGSESALMQVQTEQGDYELVFPLEQTQTRLPESYWLQAARGQVVIENQPANPALLPDVERILVLPLFEHDHYRIGVAMLNKDIDFDDRDIETLKIWTESVWQWLTRLRREKQVQMLSSTVAQSPNPIIITDEQARIEYVNEAFTQCTGYSALEAKGHNTSMLKSGRTPDAVYSQMWEHLLQGKTWQGELINRRKDGQDYIERATIFPLRDGEGKIHKYIAYKEDITSVRESEQKVQQLTLYDTLTGLPNKTALRNEFNALHENAAGEANTLSLLLLDLDNFRLINEALGTEAGDLLLQELARRLYRKTGQQGILSRLSGDSFVLMLSDANAIVASEVATKVIALLSEPVKVNGSTLAVSCSVGISVYPDDATGFDALLTCAESAMYEVKSKGRNGFGFYSPSKQTEVSRQLAIANELKYALTHNEFSLVFQPQCRLKDMKMVGAEALLRWHSHTLGQVSPAEFIPLAERSGLIMDIDDWVFKTAVEQLRHWRSQGLTELTLAINLSAAQFSKQSLAKNLLEYAQRLDVPPGRIELELTEEIAIRDPEMGYKVIGELRDAGFLVALDDFGTGYSSMSYLNRFAFDKLKIDQSFIRELNGEGAGNSIVLAMIQMAKSFNMDVIAEGVEEKNQLEILRSLGCHQIQGYFYGKPMDEKAFLAFAGKQSREAVGN